jgi:hypothetical protein
MLRIQLLLYTQQLSRACPLQMPLFVPHVTFGAGCYIVEGRVAYVCQGFTKPVSDHYGKGLLTLSGAWGESAVNVFKYTQYLVCVCVHFSLQQQRANPMTGWETAP